MSCAFEKMAGFPKDVGNSIAEAIMLKTSTDMAILLLEGDDDERLLRNFVADDVYIVSAKGCDNVVRAVSVINEKFDGVIGIVDGDYNIAFGVSSSCLPNIICTDYHDLDVMLFTTDAFSKVLNELGSIKKIKDVPDIKMKIIEAAYEIGVLKMCNFIEKFRMNFDGLDFKFVCKKTLSVDMNEAVRVVLARSDSCRTKPADVFKFHSKYKAKQWDWKHVCNGHDLAEIMGKALTGIVGSCSQKEAEGIKISSYLRAAYEGKWFITTNLYKEIKNWEKREGYTCLTL